jgi:hypothetical protein
MKSSIGPVASGAFFMYLKLLCGCLALLPPAAVADPFLTRDQNPFTLVYGQPLPTPARLPPPETLAYAFTFDISNTLNLETPGAESLHVDFEAYNLNLSLMYTLNERWAVKMDMPFIYRGGGVFDHAIDEWHKIFGLPRGDRPAVADDQIRMFYANDGMTNTDLSSSQAGLADIQLGLGYSLYASPDQAVSLWGAIDLPAGDSAKLTGNDDMDYSVWMAASTRTGTLSTLDANIGVVVPGNSVLASLQTENLVFFGHAGAHFGLNDVFALKLQLAGHSGYYRDTALEFLDSAVIIVFGGSMNIGKCSTIDLGISEDIKSGTSPDIGLLISWKSRFNECG